MKKVLITLLALAISLAVFTACGNSNGSSDQTPGNTDKDLSMAYLTPGLDLPFWKYLSEGIKAEAKSNGVSIQVYDSHNDSATQLKNAQDAITKQVDAIIISPTDSSTAPAVLTQAENAGIPVIIADIGTDSGNYEALITSENKKGAEEVGKYLVEHLESKGWDKGPAAQVTISLARKNGKDRTGGFEQAMEDSGVEIAGVKQLEDYTRSEAEGFAQDLMTAHPDLHAIFGQTDEPTLGVLKAVKAANKLDEIAVVGFDATPETIEVIKNGEMLAAAVQQPVLMGKESFKAALDVINNEEVEKDITVPTILVTKDNVEDEEIEKQLKENVFPE